MRIGVFHATLTAAVLAAGSTRLAAQATDVLTVGTVSVPSGTPQVGVPIFIQDNTGTPIGRDQGPGKRVSGFALQVVYGNACVDTPATASQRINLAGGILASQSADLDNRPKQANASQSWIYSSAEANGLIPFTAAAAPGDLVGTMVFNLTGCPIGTINLVITATGGAGATLSSDSNTLETVGNGLSVVNGAINIGSTTSTPTRTPTPSPSVTPATSVTPTSPTATPTVVSGTPPPTPTNTRTNTPQITPTNTPVGVTPPAIVSINPSLGTTRGGTTVFISGNQFQRGATVFFGDAPASLVTFSNSQVLIAVTDAHAAATVDVTVTNPDGGTARLAGAFRYAPPGPIPRPRPTPRVLDRPPD
jgi:IPT/TIG domain